MTDYYKDFDRWNSFVPELQQRPAKQVQPGAIHWCNLGINVGSEIDGKGPRFTRPVLILMRINNNMAYIAPFTTQEKTGRIHPKFMVNGRPEYLLLDQIRAIDTVRIEKYIDEISSQQLESLRHQIGSLFASH